MKHTYFLYRPVRAAVLFIVFLLSTSLGYAQTIDPSFAPVVSTAGTGWGLAVQPDGKLVISGNFTSVSGVAAERVIRLLPGGGVDPSFILDPGLSGGASKVVVQPDGKILLLGNFSDRAGNFLGNVIRLLPTGAMDDSFTPIREEGRAITDFVSLPNGKVLTSTYRCIPNQPVNCGAAAIRMYAADGTNDTSFPAIDFPPNFDGTVTISVDALAVQSDNAILVGGSNLPYGDRTQDVYRFDSLGRVDPTFNPEVASISNYIVQDIALQPDGSIGILGGAGYGVTLLDSTGNTLFAGDLQPSVNATTIVATAGGNYTLLGELLTEVDGRSGQVLAVLPGITPYQYVTGTAVQGNSVVAVGIFTDVNGEFAPGIFRILVEPPGIRVDETFTVGLYRPGQVISLLTQEDGKVVLAGNFITVNGRPLRHLARLNPDGSIDETFTNLGRPADRPFYAGARLLSDGRIVAAGRGGGGVEAIVLLDRNGDDLNQFFPFVTDFTEPSVSYLAVDAEGRIYAGDGTAITSGSESYQEAYRYTLTEFGGVNVLDYGNTLIDSLDRYNGLVAVPEGKFLFYGSQIKAGGALPAPLVRALEDGSLDPTYRTDLPGNFYAMEVVILASGNSVVAGGDLVNNRLENQRFVKLDAAGRQIPGFELRATRSDGRSFNIASLLQLDPETLLVTGGFDRYGDRSVPGGRILVDTAGNYLQDFLPQLTLGEVILAAATYEDQIYVGGRFNLPSGANSLARLNNLLSGVRTPSTAAGHLSVWPNPLSGDQLHVRLDRKPSTRELTYRLYLMASRQLIGAGTLAADDQLSIPVPERLGRGAYLLVLTDGISSWSARVIR